MKYDEVDSDIISKLYVNENESSTKRIYMYNNDNYTINAYTFNNLI